MELKEIRYGALAMLALTLVSSCAIDEDFRNLDSSASSKSSGSNKEIGFMVNAGKSTRANGSYSNSFLPTQFEITAFDGDINYYNGGTDMVTTADNGNTWTSDHHRYWPTDRAEGWTGLTFYAYIDGNQRGMSRGARSESGKFDISGDVPAIRDFEVDPDVAMQRDLMYAVARNVSGKTNKGNVSLNFCHALSRIEFALQNCNPHLDNIEILSVELGGVKGKGTYRFPQSHTQGGFIITFSDETTGWEADYSSDDCSYLLSDLNLSLGSAGPTGRGEIKTLGVREGQNTAATSMFLLPQTMQARIDRNSACGAYLKLSVRKTLSGKTLPEPIEEVFIPVTVDWAEGCSYTYNLVWKSSNLDFSVSKSDF